MCQVLHVLFKYIFKGIHKRFFVIISMPLLVSNVIVSIKKYFIYCYDDENYKGTYLRKCSQKLKLSCLKTILFFFLHFLNLSFLAYYKNIIDTSILNVLGITEIFYLLDYKQRHNSYQIDLAMWLKYLF